MIYKKSLNMRIYEDDIIRKDFAFALAKVNKISELSMKLGWAFSKEDIKELAILHKNNKFREKIEDLLEDCNFHTEWADFRKGNYDKYLNFNN